MWFPADLLFLRDAGGTVAQLHPGEQDISMSVSPYGTYEPSLLTVRAGIPVKWTIDGTHAEGCTSGIVVPALGIKQDIHPGDNVITFTPLQPGTLAFSCTMGSVRGAFQVI
jgi:plastocyanin domain-containing protein